MPICIECSYPVPQLYHRSSSKKPTPSPQAQLDPNSDISRFGGEAKQSTTSNTSTDVRLVQCPRCKRFADKYVEHDFVVLFVDLVLVKPQVYRHLLFNNDRLIATDSTAFTPAIKRLGTLLVLFEVYLTWSSVEKLPAELTAGSAIPKLPILAQYLFYLVLCAIATGAQHLVVRELAQLPWFRGTTGGVDGSVIGTGASPDGRSLPKNSTRLGSASETSSGKQSRVNQHTPAAHESKSRAADATVPLPPPRKTAVSTALLVSSCTKLFPILMVVWKYEDTTGSLASGVSWAVAIQNVEALRILLGSGYGSATFLVAVGWLTSWLISRAILISVGLGGYG